MITLRINNCISNDPCDFCGRRCDPTGLDYMVKGNRLICDCCAARYAPALVSLRATPTIQRMANELFSESSPPPDLLLILAAVNRNAGEVEA